MKTLKTTLLITFIFLGIGTRAQKWVSYNTGNSAIPDNSISDIAIDALGNKWIATFLGIAKFNGTTWTVYDRHNSGLASNLCNSILIDKDGNIWVGTMDGAFRFNPTTSVWTTYRPDAVNNAIERSVVYSMAADSKGNIWFGHDLNYLSKFDGTTWTAFRVQFGTAEYDVNCMEVDQSSDNLWFTLSGVVFKLVGNTYYQVPSAGNEINVMHFDPAHNTAWFGANDGVTSGSGTTWTFYDRFDVGLPGEVTSIGVSAQNIKYFGTTGGFVKFAGSTWTVFNTTNSGIPANEVSAIAIESNGMIWLGNSGLVKYNPNATGIDEIKSNKETKVFPNPATDRIFVEGSKPNSTVSIYNVTGQLVLTHDLSEGSIDVSSLVKGIFMIQISDHTGVSTHKLLIQ